MKNYFWFVIILIFGCERKDISKHDILSAEKISGLSFSPSERDSLLPNVIERVEQYNSLREIELQNDTPFPLFYDPLPIGLKPPRGRDQFKFNDIETSLPDNIEACAFVTIPELANLIRTRQVTSEALTRMYIERLKRYTDQLQCVVTITEELAIKQAKKADIEIARGQYKGLLHGIPWGAKDLMSVPGYKTTWGATPFKDQLIDNKGTVVKKLEEAGAVLIAKLTLGALAWGDVWFGGKTKNPWDVEQGSSGSSAGIGVSIIS